MHFSMQHSHTLNREISTFNKSLHARVEPISNLFSHYNSWILHARNFWQTPRMFFHFFPKWKKNRLMHFIILLQNKEARRLVRKSQSKSFNNQTTEWRIDTIRTTETFRYLRACVAFDVCEWTKARGTISGCFCFGLELSEHAAWASAVARMDDCPFGFTYVENTVSPSRSRYCERACWRRCNERRGSSLGSFRSLDGVVHWLVNREIGSFNESFQCNEWGSVRPTVCVFFVKRKLPNHFVIRHRFRRWLTRYD